jgi:Collagen triple helix repeat (20 copies)
LLPNIRGQVRALTSLWLKSHKRVFVARWLGAGAAAGGILLVLGSVVAFASVPDSVGAIHACYSSSGQGQGNGNGNGRGGDGVRIIDSATQVCSPDETAITWNQTGPQGPMGPQGIAGLQGLPGANGLPGKDGPPGADGAAGPQGLPGPQGAVGPAGPAGPKGNDGAAGPQGPMGPQGIPGLPGVDGGPGAPGLQGPQGPVGPAGADGPMGPQGIPGPAGAQGPAGVSGWVLILGPTMLLNNSAAASSAVCPLGEHVLGGGYNFTGSAFPLFSIPDSTGGFASQTNPNGLGWTVEASNNFNQSGTFRAFATCGMV